MTVIIICRNGSRVLKNVLSSRKWNLKNRRLTPLYTRVYIYLRSSIFKISTFAVEYQRTKRRISYANTFPLSPPPPLLLLLLLANIIVRKRLAFGRVVLLRARSCKRVLFCNNILRCARLLKYIVFTKRARGG